MTETFVLAASTSHNILGITFMGVIGAVLTELNRLKWSSSGYRRYWRILSLTFSTIALIAFLVALGFIAAGD